MVNPCAPHPAPLPDYGEREQDARPVRTCLLQAKILRAARQEPALPARPPSLSVTVGKPASPFPISRSAKEARRTVAPAVESWEM